MQKHPFEAFLEYTISSEEALVVQGGGVFINQEIMRLLCEKKGYETPLNEWKHADFRYWSYQLDVSINTIKRWL
jgi:shikimate kinase